MSALTPKEAIGAAIGVYDLEFGRESPENVFSRHPDINNRFDFKGTEAFDSETGAFLKFKSGFGVAALSKENPDTKIKRNDALITIRGTRGLADWLSDANIGMQLSETSKVVHAGFNRVFNEFSDELRSFFQKHSVDTIHCVGHSLGGALATLAADSLSHHGLASNIKLYTFGCPRVGFEPFSRRLTTNIGANNIYRVYHNTDPVSMIPQWPFIHAPQPGNTYSIPGSGHNVVSAHFKDNYLKSVKKMNGDKWGQLPYAHTGEPSADEVINWLTKSVTTLSSFTLRMIGGAIKLIISVANLAIVPGMTALDLLSQALSKAASASKEALGLTKMLMKNILSMLGHSINETAKFTAQFIRWVFDLLSKAVYKMVSMAINLDFTR
ncbi:lipase family protein [Pseudomonadota bacterium]